MEFFGWKIFSKLTNCYFFKNRAENFRLAVRNKSAWLSSCFLPLLGNFLKKFFWKVFAFFWTFFQIFSGNWARKVWPACQNCIHRIYKIISKKIFFWKTNEIFHHFQTLSRKISASFRVFRRRCWSCIVGVQNNILTKNSFISSFRFILGHWAIFLTNSC